MKHQILQIEQSWFKQISFLNVGVVCRKYVERKDVSGIVIGQRVKKALLTE